MVCYYVSGKSPDIRGVHITEQTKIEISPDQPQDYHWEGHGFNVQIPAGAFATTRPVTRGKNINYLIANITLHKYKLLRSRSVSLLQKLFLHFPVVIHIRAGLSGEYKLPDDRVLVSEVFRLSLDPPVETFHKKVTLALQHCALDDDSTLTFITSTQDNPPYTFLPLPGGSFSESGLGAIDVDHFSPFGLIGKGKSYTFCTFYLPIENPKTHEVHITVTPNLKDYLEVYHGLCNIEYNV